MEEQEYKSTYNELTQVRCVFEKTLTNNWAKCSLAEHFCLADREGYSCRKKENSETCRELLEKLRKNSSFSLKLHEVDGPLPHNMEMRVQVGGLIGLLKVADNALDDVVTRPVIADIVSAIDTSVAKFGSLDNLPYSEIIQSVVSFQGRQRRQK